MEWVSSNDWLLSMIKTLHRIAHQHWPTFNLHSVVNSGFRTLIPVDLGHDLHSFSDIIGFQTLIPEWNQLGSWYLAPRCILLASCIGVIIYLTSKGHALLSFSHFGFWTLILEWNQLESCYMAHWCILCGICASDFSFCLYRCLQNTILNIIIIWLMLCT